MKYKVIITHENSEIIYKGKPLNIPVKKESIVKKSIELFGDDEPCIIHQSYAVQKLINEFIESLSGMSVKNLSFSFIHHDFSFIDVKDIDHCFLTLEG